MKPDWETDKALEFLRSYSKMLYTFAMVIKKGVEALQQLPGDGPPKEIGGKKDDPKPRG